MLNTTEENPGKTNRQKHENKKQGKTPQTPQTPQSTQNILNETYDHPPCSLVASLSLKCLFLQIRQNVPKYRLYNLVILFNRIPTSCREAVQIGLGTRIKRKNFIKILKLKKKKKKKIEIY